MFIERDLSKSKVTDFIMNVQSKLNSGKIATEVYDKRLSSMVIGWNIEELKK